MLVLVVAQNIVDIAHKAHGQEGRQPDSSNLSGLPAGLLRWDHAR